ncbi:MAG: tRNA (adenosine(37)-N6)-threonylcarbamoyltransferase complex transferase subunit TsaD [Treponema sp.]|nr:tRNA (adenosine(37)-N6)-threonylcarbamoyltransferase complex transferase subunit TsaD [Treponema sp.]
MVVLGIETSCDECAAAVVHNGIVLSNVVATQIPFHSKWQGVVPEIASRMHTEWIYDVAGEAIKRAGLKIADIEGAAATAHPGLLGSLLVGLHFAKAFAWARNLPFIAVDHLLAHLYASRLVIEGQDVCSADYPFLGLLVSGGHSVICRVDNFDDVTVLGTTVDDAAGEAFDKIAKHYSFGYPGGAAIDKLAQKGNSEAFKFPMPNLYKPYKQGNDARYDHRYDLSYSGLKTAVVNQLEQFRVLPDTTDADIAASFQKTAVEILLRALFRAVEDTGLQTIVAGGGVAANSYLRTRLEEYVHTADNKQTELKIYFPPLELCGDNAAMVAGLGEQYLLRGDRSPLNVSASARVRAFKRR